jgi:hypothetical protein
LFVIFVPSWLCLQGGEASIELGDRLFEHRAMRGRARGLKVGHRARPRQHQRGMRRVQAGVAWENRWRAAAGLGG